MRSMLSRFWVAAAILPLLAGFAFAPTHGLFVCRGDRVARIECCCPSGAHGSSTALGANAVLAPACCCDRSQLEAPPLVPGVPEVTVPVTPNVSLALVTTIDFHSIAPGTWSWQAHRYGDPLPRAVPILLGKHSFLI